MACRCWIAGFSRGKVVVMYVTRVPNRDSPPAVLLRESYREGGKVRNRTLANLSRWPEQKVAALEDVLKGRSSGAVAAGAFEVARSLPHGHVAAALGTAGRLGLPELLDARPSRRRDLALALVVARVIAPAPKLATARGLRAETASSSLGQLLGVDGCDEDDLYAAMDWLGERQDAVEDALAARHLSEATLVLYDVSSAAFEGTTCPLARLGYPRDGVKGRLQVVYGMLTNKHGVPVATEVFEGNTADPATVAAQVAKLRHRFGLANVVLVGDRGMLTRARVDADVAPAGFQWVTALRAPTIKALVADGAVQLSLFDQTDLAEVTHPEFPGERLVVCRNPALAAERARQRAEVVAAYKRLAGVERVFRIFNGDLDVRPIHHRLARRVRAHFFVCMLAHYLEWHMLERLAPLLFVDDDKAAAEAQRSSPVAPAQRSATAKSKDARKRNADGERVHSFPSLLADLATLCANRIEPIGDAPAFHILTTPTPLQRRAFELLGVAHRLGFA